ncbi:hypothetical protein VHN57_05020 [Sphingobium sp. WW5]|uniref:hypothetical protein n=2 Tax=Sphingobium TaxID=165695 RepID=UPI003C1663A3
MWAKLNMLGHYIRSNVTVGTYDLLNALNEHEENQSSYGIYASGPFKLFGREHELVLGGGHRRIQFDGNTNQGGLRPATSISTTLIRPRSRSQT